MTEEINKVHETVRERYANFADSSHRAATSAIAAPRPPA